MKDVGQLWIGPVSFRLEAAPELDVRYSRWAYAGFYAPPPADSAPVDALTVRIRRGALPPPESEPLWRGGLNWAAWERGAELILCAGFAGRNHARWHCRVDRALTRAELTVASGAEVCEAPLEYPLDQILTWGLLARAGGVLLHAAVAVRDGRGLVLAGRSGAGKSTLANLCHEAGWRILNDDRVLVYPTADGWRVAGTPWHGSGRFAVADSVPLAGVCLLQQAAAESLEEVPASMARLALLDVAAVPWFLDDWAQAALDGLDNMLGSVPVRRFHFTKQPVAVAALAELQDGRLAEVSA